MVDVSFFPNLLTSSFTKLETGK